MILVIAEKPSVAREIAKVVGATKKEKGYLFGEDYIVSWCFGHLLSLAQPASYGEQLQKWRLETLPIIPEEYKLEILNGTSDQYHILEQLMRRDDVTELIEATDAGREGELIFRLVYDYAGCNKPFRRLWISSMEEQSIRDGLATMKPSSAYDNLYQAALCRQRADWLMGINLTRLYSTMYHTKLTCGRVQTPTLNLIVQRQIEVDHFKPKPYYRIIADLGVVKAYCKVDDKSIADKIVAKCTSGTAIVKQVDVTQKTEKPYPLYDLTTLQREANRLLGYSAQQSLDYLQKLYDNKLATYPRTDSRYITSDQAVSTQNLIETILAADVLGEEFAKHYDVKNVNVEQVVHDKKVTDHHGILPTSNLTQATLSALPSGERNILLLVVYRLLASVYTPYVYQKQKLEFDIAGESFSAHARADIDQGYKFVGHQMKQAVEAKEEKSEDDVQVLKSLVPVDNGQEYPVLSISWEQKKTKPNPSYTEDTLLRAMETAGKAIENDELSAMMVGGLGTPATRAGIIENLINTGYITRDGKKLLPTSQAYTFIGLVTDKIKQPELTAEWEKQLYEIERGQESPDAFMDQVSGFLVRFVGEAKSSYSPEQSAAVFQRQREVVGDCPRCGKQVIEYTKNYSCESGKDGCHFVIWKTIAGKSISKTQAASLLKRGKSSLIKGFTGKSGKVFDAYLVLKEDQTVGFDFPAKERK